MGESALYVMWVNLVIFNVAIVLLLKYALQGLDLKEVLREKAPAAQPPPLLAVAAPALPAPAAAGLPAAVAAPAVAAVAAPLMAPLAAPDNTSYSRVAGMVGAIVLAAFFWALGNIILYKAFANIAEAKELVSAVSTYILSASALFAPYAVNQLTTIFKG